MRIFVVFLLLILTTGFTNMSFLKPISPISVLQKEVEIPIDKKIGLIHFNRLSPIAGSKINNKIYIEKTNELYINKFEFYGWSLIYHGLENSIEIKEKISFENELETFDLPPNFEKLDNKTLLVTLKLKAEYLPEENSKLISNTWDFVNIVKGSRTVHSIYYKNILLGNIEYY